MTEIAAPARASGPAETTGGLRARQARRVHDELLHAGLELMTDVGYDQVTVEAISRHAGVSPRTFFRYYASKDALLTAPFIALAERLVAEVVDQPADTDAWTALRHATLAAVEELEADPTTFRRAARIAASSPSPLMPSASRLAELEATITDAAARRLPAGADPLAAPLLSGLQAVVLRTAIEAWISASDPRPLTELAIAALDALGDGVRRMSSPGPT